MKNRNLPYGYCYVNGIIIAHSEETAVVNEICTEYLAGKSLLTIAEMLNERQIEYMPGVIGWNKARLKRILEDERYLGKTPYQRIISQEAYEAIQAVKNARNTQKDTDRQADIYQLPVPVICSACQSKMKRIYASKRKCKTRWVCENRECRLSLDKEDGELLNDITELVNHLIANPHAIQMPTPQATEPSMELRILNNEIARMLDSIDIKRDDLRAKMLQCISQRYKEINPAPYTARKLISVLTESEPLTAFHAELIGRTVNAVILNTDRSVSLILTNNQIIGKELYNGANNPSTESGQSDTADGQHCRNGRP